MTIKKDANQLTGICRDFIKKYFYLTLYVLVVTFVNFINTR